ncbi:MAG: ABC transporter ATP-binding protein [Candidatus Dojkabacteria bacterium]|nr:ABC transporter ATP-binding protein [Candidatus Dojkabacteria bacterium]
MLKLFKYLKPYIPLIIVMLVLTYIQVMTNLALPDYMAKIVNEGIVLENEQLILETGVSMLLVTGLGALCTIVISYLSARIGNGFSRKLREDVFNKVSGFSLGEMNKFSIASLITRTTNDIQQVQMVIIMLFRMVMSAPIMGIGAVIKAYNTAPSMTWIMGVAVAILLTVIIIVFAIATPKFKLVQKLVDKLNLVTRQNLTGLRVIRAFNTEKYEEKRFDKANRDLTSINLFLNRVMVMMQPIMMLLLNLTMISVIWVGAHLVNSNDLQIGDMMAFMQYAMQTIASFLMVSMIFILIPRASVSGQRIVEVLDEQLSIRDPKESKKSTKKEKGVLTFDNVTFKYPDADVPILHNISFTAKAGETTAIIGGTGSGKSTVINLIPRLFDVTSGQILIDGVDIRDMKQKELRGKIGYIPQKGVLFSGTIESNIKYGQPNATKKEVKKAAQIAQASEFIDKLEEGYKAPIAQEGTNVSGGQKQRVSIARAIVRNPEIYIFDDSFSALDFKTDAKLRKELKSVTKNSIVIVVAQRIGTILDAEQIIVLDEGKIVGIGKHEQLMKTCEIYKEIALSQLSRKELGNGE